MQALHRMLHLQAANADAHVQGKESLVWEPRPVHALAPMEMPVQLPASAGAAPQPAAERELYCNDSLYIFWRLYHFLYDRLRTVRDCVLEKAGAKRAPGGEVRRPLPDFTQKSGSGYPVCCLMPIAARSFGFCLFGAPHVQEARLCMYALLVQMRMHYACHSKMQRLPLCVGPGPHKHNAARTNPRAATSSRLTS